MKAPKKTRVQREIEKRAARRVSQILAEGAVKLARLAKKNSKEEAKKASSLE